MLIAYTFCNAIITITKLYNYRLRHSTKKNYFLVTLYLITVIYQQISIVLALRREAFSTNNSQIELLYVVLTIKMSFHYENLLSLEYYNKRKLGAIFIYDRKKCECGCECDCEKPWCACASACGTKIELPQTFLATQRLFISNELSF